MRGAALGAVAASPSWSSATSTSPPLDVSVVLPVPTTTCVTLGIAMPAAVTYVDRSLLCQPENCTVAIDRPVPSPVLRSHADRNGADVQPPGIVACCHRCCGPRPPTYATSFGNPSRNVI